MAALTRAGTANQTIFRNPQMSPDVLGVSAGARFGAVLGILRALPMVADHTAARAALTGEYVTIDSFSAAQPSTVPSI